MSIQSKTSLILSLTLVALLFCINEGETQEENETNYVERNLSVDKRRGGFRNRNRFFGNNRGFRGNNFGFNGNGIL